MMTTDPIVYNVRERGRKFRGQDRCFDTAALASLINSPEVQEKVRHGDMLGYFGHWPRKKFGMEPQEGGILDGKVVSLPVALKTVELSATPDGTITHRAQFLDTNEGRIAQRLYESKSGGFSSAITPLPGTMPIIPKGFFGFDYVYEPNYTTNRGHKVILDGVEVEVDDENELIVLLDQVAEEGLMAASALNALFDSLHTQHTQTLQSMEAMHQRIERLMAENAALVSMAAAKVAPVLDSVGTLGVMAKPARNYGAYRQATLAPLASLIDPKAAPDDGAVRLVKERMGIRRG
jgi:hypothetical protein